VRIGGVSGSSWRVPGRTSHLILRDRSALARQLLRRGEPLLLWCVGLHVTLLEVAEGSVSALLVAAVCCQVAAASFARRGTGRWAAARAAMAAALLLVSFVASDPSGRLSLLVWFTILPVGFAVAVGLRRAWPVVAGMLVPHALAVGDVFESGWMVPMWALPTFGAGIVLGLVSDLLSEVADAATRAHDHERRLRTSVDTAPIGILTVDLDGRTTLVNALITDFIQVDEPPADLASFARHVHPADVGVLAEMHDAIRAGRGMRRGMRVVHPDLGVRDIRVITAPMVDDEGALIGAALTLQDVHEDLDNRRKLEQFRSIADTTSDIVVIASYRPHLDYLNSAGQTFFGGPPSPSPTHPDASLRTSATCCLARSARR
jgi:PAS domain-containing protein